MRLLRILSDLEDLQRQMSRKQQVTGIAVITVIFFISLLAWILNTPKKRYVFLFEAFDSGKVCMEERYIPFENREEIVSLFTGELLLGSGNSRYKALFTTTTKPLFCFLREKTLFINFSGDIINNNNGTSDINRGFDLYRKNILHNFKNIKNIKMFADGHEVF